MFFTFFLFQTEALHSAALSNIRITGIKDEVLLNVQHRLEELYKDKSMRNESTDALRVQIEKAIQPYGFFKSTITFVSAEQHLTIKINPGPQLHITALSIKVIGEGRDNIDIQNTLAKLDLHVGQPFNSDKYEDAKNSLASSAEDAGFLHARFETAQLLITPSSYTASITLILNTGPRYYFGQVKFDPTVVSPELLHRYVPFKWGQPYSTAQLLKLNSQLASSGYFKDVNVTPTIRHSPEVPLDVHLQPADPIHYSLGAGYGTDTGPRGRLGVSVIPVNRAGHKFNAIAQGSMVQNTIQGQYIIPGTNPVNDQYNINGGLTNLNYRAGRSKAILFGFAQQHIVHNYQQTLSLNGLNERFNYTDFPTFNETIFFPKAVLTWSQTSDPLFSPSGYKITFNGLAASSAILSQVSLAQASVDARAAITIEALRTRFYLHAIQGVTAINDIYRLPLSIAQLLGGAEDLKGYSYNSIGPGKLSSYAGIELQKETAEKLYVLAFFDAGNVYRPALKNTLYDAGGGVMWVSPVGPIKVALAQAIDAHLQRLPNHSPKLVVSIGPDI